MLQVQRGEGCLVIYDFVTSFKAEKWKVNVSDAGFRFSPISLSLSLSLALSLSLSLRAGVLVCGYRLPSFDLVPLSRNVFYSVFVFRSDHIEFYLFLPRRSRIARKITFNYFHFLTNFIDILLCIDPMRRNSFFHFEEILSTDNIWWMPSWTLVGIIILCGR